MTPSEQLFNTSRYFWFGLIALVAAIGMVFGELRLFALGRDPSFGWQVTTGCGLLLLLGYQWALAVIRIGKMRVDIRWHLETHRWTGVAIMVLFLLHAVRAGYAWTAVLTIVFLLAALTGLLNREVVRYPKKWMYLTWLGAHVALSTVMIPLVGVHMWVALLYQGTQ